MPDPTKYTPAYDFSAFQAVRPNTPLPGDRVDIELQNLDDVIEALVAAVKDVRRADGKLQNGSVTADSFEAGLRDAITTDTYAASEAAAASAAAASTSQGAAAASASAALASQDAAAASASAALAVEDNLPDWRGAWVTATAYDTGDLVRVLGSSYICLIAHTAAADFSTDLSASRWDLFAQEGAAGSGTGDMRAANNLSDVAAPATARANLGVPETSTVLLKSGSLGGLADPAAALSNLGLTATAADINANMPVGVPFPVWDHITGCPAPSNAGTAKFIRLTAGQTGAGQYNEGLLGSESVAGSAPAITATATILTGPMTGQIVPLVNTEEAFLRPRTTSGGLQTTATQAHKHRLPSGFDNSAFYGWLDGADTPIFGSEVGSGSVRIATNSGTTTSSTAAIRAAYSDTVRDLTGETRPRNRSATFYMRIV